MSRFGPSEITRDHIQALVRDAVREVRSVEYKQALPGSTDEDRREFLADVASFANAHGGDLIFGVAAKDGVPVEALGLAAFTEDKERLRVESMIRDGIAPRLSGVRIHIVSGFPQGPVMLIQVPRSWSGPHMVTFKGSSRFFTRGSAGKYQMDVGELRSAFALSESLPERIRAWRQDRLGRIEADDTPVPLRHRSKLVLHIVPASSFRNELALSPTALRGRRSEFAPLGGFAGNWRINLDGFLTWSGRPAPEPATSYCQIFRSGRVESVMSELVYNVQDRLLLPAEGIEEYVIKGVSSYMGGLKALGVDVPIVVALTMIGAKGASLAPMGVAFGLVDLSPIDRDVLVLPDVLAEDYGDSPETILRPAFDAFWNASGAAGSPNYDKDGRWNPRRR